MKAHLISIAAIADGKWHVVFDINGSTCRFDMTHDARDDSLSVDTLTEAFDFEDEDADEPINELVEAVRDEMYSSGLFKPVYAHSCIRDSDFSNDVSGARAARNLFWVDPSMRGRELFEALLGYAQAEAMALDLSDYDEVAAHAENLWLIAAEMDVICETDRPRRLVQAVEAFSTACQDVELDEDGEEIPPEGIAELKAARDELLDAE